ncbi:hypothetical protein ACR1PO_15570 [Chryseobacterium sp. RRHN12]|uniref:hypothetical protein n=1 Tax=Chryseobacterium sp. RRHN12 TaxID=3437884 RepID=UPI003D9ACB03
MKQLELEMKKSDAYYAYLELCNAIAEVPRKEIYESINNCDDAEKLEEIISIIEKEHSDFEKKK